MAHRSNYPTFDLPRPDGKASLWSQEKKKWLSAAARLSAEFDHDYIFEPIVNVETDEVSRVKVKIVKKVSAWAPERLFPRDGQGVCVVIRGRSGTLSRHELRQRRRWRWADRA